MGPTKERDGTPLTLCVLLWAHEGQADALVAYEDEVLTVLGDHGGSVVERARTDGSGDLPLEVQLLAFPSETALDTYMADERRQGLAPARKRAVARTEVMRVELLG